MFSSSYLTAQYRKLLKIARLPTRYCYFSNTSLSIYSSIGSSNDFSQGGESTSAETTNTAQLVTDTIMNSINNGTAVAVQMEDSKTYKLASLSAFVSSVPALQAEILSVVSHNEAFLKKCSNALGGFAFAANLPFTIMGVTDGDISGSDWLNILSTLSGAIGTFTSLAPPIAFAFNGLSFVLSIASLCVSGSENNSSTNNNY